MEMLLQDLLGGVVEKLVDVATGPCCFIADYEASEACRRGLKDLLIVEDPR